MAHPLQDRAGDTPAPGALGQPGRQTRQGRQHDRCWGLGLTGHRRPEGSTLAQPGAGDRGAAQVGLEDELLGDEGGHPRTALSVTSQPASPPNSLATASAGGWTSSYFAEEEAECRVNSVTTGQGAPLTPSLLLLREPLWLLSANAHRAPGQSQASCSGWERPFCWEG